MKAEDLWHKCAVSVALAGAEIRLKAKLLK
jgi:hypothetical protein